LEAKGLESNLRRFAQGLSFSVQNAKIIPTGDKPANWHKDTPFEHNLHLSILRIQFLEELT
jgi:hypothetical protein